MVAAATLVPLVPTSAHADTYLNNDAVGDVVAGSTSSDTTTPEPARLEGDIAYSKVRHRARKVVMTMRYRELTASSPMLHYFALATGKMRRYVYVYAGPGHWGGKVEFDNAQGKKVRCHVTRTIDYTANSATVSVPRSCLGRPKWVKVAMAQATFDTVTEGKLYLDDARSAGDFNQPRWSPRVYR